MSEELKITKERVLSAAGKCGTAKDILKELFPEVFKVKEEWAEAKNIVFTDGCLVDKGLSNGPILWFLNKNNLEKKECWFDGSQKHEYKIENYTIWRRKSE